MRDVEEPPDTYSGSRLYAPMPEDLRPGDLLATPAAGAYQLSMSSSYNLVGRPPLVAVCAGTASVIQRRETLEDLTARDGFHHR